MARVKSTQTRTEGLTSRTLAWIELFRRGEADAARWYDLLGQTVLGTGEPLANMGYWGGTSGERPATLSEASRRMWDLVATDAGLSSETRLVIDAGCGFGTSTRRWVERWGVQHALGVNLSGSQLEWARKTHGDPHGRVRFVEASATSLPVPDAGADAVVSIEAAFHFMTRQAFLREASRVLRPGGRLAFVDLVAEPPRSPMGRAVLTWIRRGVQYPRENVETLDQLRQGLETAGFDIERFDTIEADVVPAFRRWFFSQPLTTLLGSYNVAMMVGTAGYFLWPWRYVRVAARRREAPGGNPSSHDTTVGPLSRSGGPGAP